MFNWKRKPVYFQQNLYNFENHKNSSSLNIENCLDMVSDVIACPNYVVLIPVGHHPHDGNLQVLILYGHWLVSLLTIPQWECQENRGYLKGHTSKRGGGDKRPHAETGGGGY